MRKQDLIESLNTLLHPELFKDYAPNGLQVEGKDEIKRIVTAVSATQNVIDRAVQLQADALLVHHGWFWRGENPAIVATKYKRLKTLMSAEINLIAYHLPLDAHETLGNNAQMAALLNAQDIVLGGEGNFIWSGKIAPVSVQELAQCLEKALNRKPLVLGDASIKVERLAWCSGSAENFFEAAIAMGAQAYISGEATERTTHLARESEVPFLVCGHHATERLGIRALGDWIEEKHGLECIFFFFFNPI